MSETIKPATKRHKYTFQAYYIQVTISQMKTTYNSVVRQYYVVYWHNSSLSILRFDLYSDTTRKVSF